MTLDERKNALQVEVAALEKKYGLQIKGMLVTRQISDIYSTSEVIVTAQETPGWVETIDSPIVSVKETIENANS